MCVLPCSQPLRHKAYAGTAAGQGALRAGCVHRDTCARMLYAQEHVRALLSGTGASRAAHLNDITRSTSFATEAAVFTS